MVKNLPANAGDVGLIPGSGRSPGVGNNNPFPYSCLENSMDRGAWRATAHGVEKSQTQFSNLTTTTNNIILLYICTASSLSIPLLMDI